MVAFAANSLLCRAALGADRIDPASFTGLRLLSGALLLWPLPRLLEPADEPPRPAGSWVSAAALFVYAIAFSWSYVTLDAGTGALVLFGSVQATMIGTGMARGERPRPGQWLGLVAALGGLVYLVSPGLKSPDPLGATLMALAGAAWGVYSLRGRSILRPLAATGGNFARAVPLAAVAAVVAGSSLHAGPVGLALAVVSGGVTSGLGYVLWYRALGDMTATTAAIVQLVVPVLAAAGGVLFLAERPGVRLLMAAVLILGGVATAILSRRAN